MDKVYLLITFFFLFFELLYGLFYGLFNLFQGQRFFSETVYVETLGP